MSIKLLNSAAFLTLAATIGIVAPSSTHAQAITPGCVNDRYGNVQCPPPGGSCLIDFYGEVRCSPPDGGIFLDRYRNAVCGPGQCIVDRLGEVRCSSVAKGYAALDREGNAVCTDGCVDGSAKACATAYK
jgi:hypothetical protein